MVTDDGYRLHDCGDGRRLESFGSLLVDRAAAGATAPRRAPDRWAGAAVYHPGSGWWRADGRPMPDDAHRVRIAGLTVEVRPTASGAVGLFPEHAFNAAWLSAAIRARPSGAPRAAEAAGPTAGGAAVLNLFGYTGLATLIAASAGAAVVHVDSSRPAVQWARRNAELSGLAGHAIRWIVDDALGFVRREIRRGRRYAGLILDPPSYGHGARDGGAVRDGQVDHEGRGTRPAWRFEERINELLDACAGVAEADAFWVLTAHTPGWDPARLVATLRAATEASARQLEGVPLQLVARSGAVLRLGAAARFDPLRVDRR